MNSSDRNPWTPLAKADPFNFRLVWREFLWDLRRPRSQFRRSVAGLKGQNPDCTEGERMLGLALMAYGGLKLLLIAVLVVLVVLR